MPGTAHLQAASPRFATKAPLYAARHWACCACTEVSLGWSRVWVVLQMRVGLQHDLCRLVGGNLAEDGIPEHLRASAHRPSDDRELHQHQVTSSLLQDRPSLTCNYSQIHSWRSVDRIVPGHARERHGGRRADACLDAVDVQDALAAGDEAEVDDVHQRPDGVSSQQGGDVFVLSIELLRVKSVHATGYSRVRTMSGRSTRRH